MSKAHYEVLDGLRGTAALMVVLFHFSEPLLPDPQANPLGHVFLAVDFFFCLSGFVMGYAYDQRRDMGVGEFFKARLIRLHPLVLVGVTLGLLSFLFDPFAGSPWRAGGAAVWMSYVASLLLLPYAANLPDRFDLLFPLNAPAWSLCWEYVANVTYALLLWRLPRRALLVLVIVAAAALIAMGWQAGSLDGGWGLGNWWKGAPRTAFSFFAGLLAWRYRVILRTRLGYASLSLLLVVALLMARHWLIEMAVVMVLFPLIVAMGAGAKVTCGRGLLCRFMGRISYPLYITHNLLIWPFGHFIASHRPGPELAALIVAASTLVAIGMAYAVLRWFDEPLRAWLKQRWLRPNVPSGASLADDAAQAGGRFASV